jgi:hypothetical protein
MRDAYCPICRQMTEVFFRLRFGAKMHLPTEVELRYCGRDNFLFSAGGRQGDYDQYYATVANDSYHQELSGGDARSPISELQNDHLVVALDGFFAASRKVLDFGCGEASLLLELATNFPSSAFFGFEPGPAAHTASSKAKRLGLDNLSITDLKESTKRGRYDLVIASHVIEHVLDFDLLHLIRGLLAEGGLLYVEVPDSLHYETHQRLEFLYYFDRLHVNHFTPQSLARLVTGYGFGYIKHLEYTFPYRDGGEYPALGMLFEKGVAAVDIVSPNIHDGTIRYIGQEKERSRAVAALLEAFEGVLVWGAGDNFYRSVENGGPLSSLRHIVLLDRRHYEVTIGNWSCQTIDPRTGIRNHPWPVVVTVSEGRKEISRQVTDIDPDRRILLI